MMVTYAEMFAFCSVIIGVIGTTLAVFSLLVAVITLIVTILGKKK